MRKFRTGGYYLLDCLEIIVSRLLDIEGLAEAQIARNIKHEITQRFAHILGLRPVRIGAGQFISPIKCSSQQEVRQSEQTSPRTRC